MMESQGLSDSVSVTVERALRIEPWMLVVLLIIYILIREWRIRRFFKKLERG